MVEVKKIVIGDTEVKILVNKKIYNFYKNIKTLAKKVSNKFTNLVKRNS